MSSHVYINAVFDNEWCKGVPKRSPSLTITLCYPSSEGQGGTCKWGEEVEIWDWAFFSPYTRAIWAASLIDVVAVVALLTWPDLTCIWKNGNHQKNKPSKHVHTLNRDWTSQYFRISPRCRLPLYPCYPLPSSCLTCLLHLTQSTTTSSCLAIMQNLDTGKVRLGQHS